MLIGNRWEFFQETKIKRLLLLNLPFVIHVGLVNFLLHPSSSRLTCSKKYYALYEINHIFLIDKAFPCLLLLMSRTSYIKAVDTYFIILFYDKVWLIMYEINYMFLLLWTKTFLLLLLFSRASYIRAVDTTFNVFYLKG